MAKTTSKVTVSVPGKVHLMGEHAVVYGKPALLSAVNLRLYLTIEKGNKEDLEIVTTETTEYIKHAMSVIMDRFRIKNTTPLKITVKSEIPPGYHLGSSAAVAVAVSAAAIYYFRKLWNPALFNELAYEIEKKQHVNPSGGDNTAVTFGGLIWFRKEFEFLKSIWSLPFKPDKGLDNFYLVDTGRPVETTGEMVEMVKRKVAGDREKMTVVFDQNEIETKKITLSLRLGDQKSLIESMIRGENTLEQMGVVSAKVRPLISAIAGAGGAAKILGGGGVKAGVGYILAYHRSAQKLESIVLASGYKVKKISLGGEGVRLEK